jgi:hypothetical protein
LTQVKDKYIPLRDLLRKNHDEKVEAYLNAISHETLEEAVSNFKVVPLSKKRKGRGEALP